MTPSSTTESDTPSLVELFTTFTPITEFPLPWQDGIEDFVTNHPQFDEEEDADMHVDELHDEHINEIARNHDWMVFTVPLYGYENDVYMWNTQLGEGLRMPRDEWQFGTFAEVVSLARTATDAWNHSEDPARPETGGCPYCDDADSEDMSSSTRPSGSTNQQCTNCGRSRHIG